MNRQADNGSGDLQTGDPAPTFEERPVFGLPVRVPTEGRPLVLVFIRHLGDPFARQTLSEIQGRYADFDRAGVLIAAVTQTDLDTARDVVPRYHVLCPVVTAPEGALQALYGIRSDRLLLGSLKGLVSGSPSRLLAALQHGHGKKAGPSRQLPAEFVIDRAGQIAHLRYSTSITDGPHLDDLLRIATRC